MNIVQFGIINFFLFLINTDNYELNLSSSRAKRIVKTIEENKDYICGYALLSLWWKNAVLLLQFVDLRKRLLKVSSTFAYTVVRNFHLRSCIRKAWKLWYQVLGQQALLVSLATAQSIFREEITYIYVLAIDQVRVIKPSRSQRGPETMDNIGSVVSC